MVSSSTPLSLEQVLVFAIGAGLAVGALAAIAEWIHARRIARIARLAFGGDGRPAAWTHLAPFVRIIGLALAAFGATLLFLHDPVEADETPNPRASRQVLVVLDVSPSMNIADAGPNVEKEMRGVWAGKVLRGILDRLDMKDTRISLIAFYTKALPVLQDTSDKNLIAGLMDGLPLYTAFKAGDTDMQAGLDAAFAMAKPWPRGSTTLVVIGDGDLTKPVVPRNMPASIADAIVIGVGDPIRPTILSGHSSKQDSWMLKGLAAKLGGIYHDGNTRQLPTDIVERLASVAPRIGDGVSLRELGLVTIASGAFFVALISPALLLFGHRAATTSRAHATSHTTARRIENPALSRTSLGGSPS